MPDSTTTEVQQGSKQPAEAPSESLRVAKALAMVSLLLLAAVAATVVHDARHLQGLEQAVEETAVGDTDCQVIGNRRINHQTVEATFQGVPLYFAYLKEIKVDDASMRRIGRDDENRYHLYRPDNPKLQKTADGRPLYYIKRRPGRYAQLHDRPEELMPRVLGR